MAKDHALMEDSNPSSNRSIHEISNPDRRIVLRGAAASAFLAPLSKLSALGGAVATVTGCATMVGSASTGPLLGFKGIAVGNDDTVRVPEGYEVQVIARWGDPVGLSGENPSFKPDATNSAAEQEAQFGMHHDGLHFYPINASNSGLLVINHEYVDDGLLHRDGLANWNAEKVRKAQAAHGVSVCEVEMKNGRWAVVTPSPWARRITARTPMTVSGPAAGHALMKTAADNTGRRVLGTINNCGSGITPWGTYLTCEENFIGN